MDEANDLHNKNCIPCKGGIPPFAISEIHKYLKKVDGWDVKKKESENYFLETGKGSRTLDLLAVTDNSGG